MATNFISQHRRATAKKWEESGVIPYYGELVIEDCEDGTFKTKLGDGYNTFPNLPYQNLDKELSELKMYVDGKVVDGLYYEDNKLYLTLNGEIVSDPVEIVGGGGCGGGSSSVIRLVNLNESTGMSIAMGSEAILKFRFTSTEDDIPTGDGTCTITVNGIVKSTYNITQGEHSIDVGSYLSVGTNTVRVKCADIYGNSRSLNYSITVIELNITSTFDDSVIYDKDITFKYIPYGLISKTIYFYIDGKEIASLTTQGSGKQITQVIPAMAHGVHRLDVYMTATLNETTVESNHLVYDIICTESGEEDPLIASVCDIEEIIQGGLVSIPYIIYDPLKFTCGITLKISSVVDGKEVVHSTQDITVDRSKQFWNTRQYPVGNVSFTIIYGKISKTHTIVVTESNIKVEAATNDLELYLTSAGRSNNESTPDVWTYNDITTTFSGFNWESNGWVADSQGDICLRLNGDARAEINLPLFKEDFRVQGKTVEFEFAVRDVNRRDAVVIDCLSGNAGLRMTADTAMLKSLSSEVTCKYKDEEKIRVAFTVDSQSSTSTRLISVYIDGILSGVQQYLTTDNFQQTNPVNIKIGSSYCGIDLYTIRIYNTSLTPLQMTNNYIADMSNIVDKIKIYEDNDIYDDYYQLSYEKVKEKLPVVTFIGDMPKYKGDKKKNSVRMIFEHPEHPELNFDEILAQIDVQGTSSAGYVRKNWKTKHNEPLTHIVGAIPAAVFCLKVDYAEATGTHNTQNANFVETLYSEKLPPQLVDERVRSTIQGFPCVIFEKATATSTPVFSSKANFNYDKGSENAFGFTEEYDVQSWEFCNNYTKLCNFLQPMDLSNTEECFASFEARYPDGYTDLSKFKEMYDWVYSTRLYDLADIDEESENAGTRIWLDEETQAAHLAEFKENFTKYFDMHFALIYYVYTFFALMTDQRAKNMFLTYWGETGKFYPYFYDNDTCFGINNKGNLVFDYYHEDQDITKDGYVFNGANSVLWYNFALCFADEIQETYSDLRSNKKISYDALANQFITQGSDSWSASIYNEDAEYKYISMARPEAEGGSNDTRNLYQVRGSGEHHLRYFLQNRIKYCDSKWHCGDFLVSSDGDDNNTITLRLYTPTTDTVKAVPFNSAITITPFSDMYCGYRYGGGDAHLHQERITKGIPYTYDPGITYANELETYLYGAQELSSLGDLSALYSGYIDVSAATKLVDLQIGNHTEGYSNTYLSEVNVGTNRLLKKIDVTNCTGLGLGDKKSLSLGNCANIEEIYATGTNLQSIELPNSGYIRKMHFPQTINNLSIRNQLYIEELFIDSDTTSDSGKKTYENIKTLTIENCPTLDTTDLLSRCPNVEWVRLTNIHWSFNTFAEFDALVGGLKGLQDNGLPQDYAYLEGTCHISELTGTEMEELRSHYTGLTISYDKLTITVTYKTEDGATELYKETIVATSGFTGANAEDPMDYLIEEGILDDIPTKESTAQYHFAYGGWSRKPGGNPDPEALKNIVVDRTVYIAFTKTIRSYNVYFYNGTVLLQTVSTEYGSNATYSGPAFEKLHVQNPELYAFTGWSPEPTNITGELSCYAQYEFLGYIKDSWATIAASVADGSYKTKYEAGKLKELTLNSGAAFDVEIVGIDHDDLADGSGKAGLSWIVKEFADITSPMNYGSTSNSGGWNASYMRTTTMADIYNDLPEELRNVIKPVIKKSSTGNMSANIVESIDNIWLPSLVELSNIDDKDEVYLQEGNTYEMFTDDFSRQKYQTDGVTLSPYWSRSAVANSPYGFWYITANGEPTTFGSDTAMNVAFGFCI